MKFKDKYNISAEFEDLFTFESEEEELDHDAQMLVFKFLEQVEKANSNGSKLKKKDIAKALNKSSSFISQLYAGDKLMNFTHLAQLQKAFDITFEVKAKPTSDDYNITGLPTSDYDFKKEPDGFLVWISNSADYSTSEACFDAYDQPDKQITAA